MMQAWPTRGVALLVLGVVACALAMTGSLLAGGLEVREACHHAVTGVWGEDYRESDPLRVECHYLLPHVICRWSDDRAALSVRVAPLPLIGLILICVCFFDIVGSLVRRRRQRRRRPEWPRFDVQGGDRQPWS